MLRKAAFIDIIATASCDSYGNTEATRLFGETAAGFIDFYADTAIQKGWADKEQIEQMKQEWRSWGENPDAFYMVPYCEAVGWKP